MVAYPDAVADSAATYSNAGITINVLYNDTDPDWASLYVVSVNTFGTEGTVTINPNGTLNYNPGAAFAYLGVGQTVTDTFQYTIKDAQGLTSTATVSVLVTGTWQPPVANADTATVAAQGGLWLNLTGNDTDPNSGVRLAVVSVGLAGTKGTVTLNPNATNGVEYSAGTAFAYLSVGETATDRFTYTVSDGHGGTSTATATVTITGVNQAPVAHADTASTTASQPVSINVLANDTDVNADDVLTVASLNLTGTQGSAVIGSGGAVIYTPGPAFTYLAAGKTATDVFNYTVSDGHGGTSTTKVTVTVAGTWLPPVANANSATTASQVPVTINVLANDSDPQSGVTLSVASVNTAGTKGTVTINANGTLTYNPGTAFATLSAGTSATDTFAYTVSDGHGSTSTATVSVTVQGVNQPPVANPDTGTVASQGALWLSLTANDTDVNTGDKLSVVSLGLAGTKGTVTLNPNATNGAEYSAGTAFAYLSVGETATDSFTYTISDGHGGTSTSTATVTITGVNQAPVAHADTASTTASQAVSINVLANDTDVNADDVLTVSALNLTGTQGTAVIGSGGAVVYTPGAAFTYLAAGKTATDSFAYTVADGHGGTSTATATVTVTGTWLPPVANANSATTASQVPVTINVLANDSDPQSGVTLSVASVNTAGTKGTVTINANGTLTYNPGTAFVTLSAGTSATDTFAYTVSDGHGSTSTATVSVVVTGVNQPPVANPDTAAVAAQSGLWLNLTGNDTDPNSGDKLSVVSLGLTGTKGTVTLNPSATNGAYYSSGNAFAYLSVGETATDTFTYTISDGHGGTSTSTATVTITGVNQAPVAHADTAATTASQPVSINVLANDTDVNADDVLTVSALNLTGTLGSAVIGSGGVVVYTPGAAFTYLAAGKTATDKFAYTVSDGHGGTSTATATVTVTGTWLPPVANANSATTASQVPVTINVLANDSDPQSGVTLSLASVNTAGTKGTVTINANGTLTYNPGTAFATLSAGTSATDTFAYTVSDGHGATSTATVSVVVTGVNQPPVANPDTGTVAAQGGLWLSLTSNDTDPNTGDRLAVVSLGLTGTKGTVTLNPSATNGAYYNAGTTFAYLSAGETATDSFTYTISDGHGGTSTSTATVTITGVNQPPVAHGDTASTTASQPVSINVLANDTDINADDVLSVSSLNLTGTQGSAVIGSGGVVVYTPGPAFAYLPAGKTATDKFAYTVSDGHGGTSTATDTVTVTGTWLPPVANADSATTGSQTPVTINVLANDTDPQSGVTLSVASVNTTGTNGSVTINANGTLTYTPGAAFQGLAPGSATTDQFSYTLSDGHGGTSTANVSMTVTAPGAAATAPKALYVATNGNDAWSGTLAQPNAAGTDGPLATPQAAETKMSADNINTVYIEGGDYYLNQTLELGPNQAGESWLAFPGETPVLHGASQVTGWTQGSNGIWTAQAPAGSFPDGGANGSLFVNGVAQTIARYPDAVPSSPVTGGWLLAAASLPGQNTSDTIQFNPGDVPAFSSTSGLYAEVYGQNGWQNYVLPVSSINYATDTITLGGTTSNAIGQGSRYFLFNAASQLNAPDEYYYDPTSNTISLVAPAGFTGAGVDVGSLDRIINVVNTSNITIAGLTVQDTPNTGIGIALSGSNNIDVAGNTIQNTGTGVAVIGSSTNNVIEGNDIAYASNDGVQISQGSNGNSVVGNNIHDLGALNDGAGIEFAGSSNDVISYNLIQNIAKDGIQGGSGTTLGSYNDTISYNQIANTNLDTSDGGGIYLSGLQQDLTGDVVDYNMISGTTAAGTVSNNGVPSMTFLSPSQLVSYGIYLDDYASGVQVTGNLLVNNVGGINLHAGWNNTISGNILAGNSGTALHNLATDYLGTGAQPSANNVFSGNLVSETQPTAIVAVNQGPSSSAQWSGNFYDLANLGNASFFSDPGGVLTSQSLAQWQASGYDAGTTTGNPMFVNPATGNYTLAAGSPALAAGIANLPTSQMGLAGFTPTNSYDLYGSTG